MNERPKALRYAEALAVAEQRIVDALPEIIDRLTTRAREGDVKAAVYLLDRIMGKAAGAKAAPADDRQLPFSEAAYQLDQTEADAHDRLREMVAQIGA